MRWAGGKAHKKGARFSVFCPCSLECPKLERIVWFKERVPDAVYVAAAEDAIQALTQQEFRVVFLDHDLHWMHAADNAIVKSTGKEVAMHLKKTGFKGIVVIHSKNEDGARVMLEILPGAKVARFVEFEIRVSVG